MSSSPSHPGATPTPTPTATLSGLFTQLSLLAALLIYESLVFIFLGILTLKISDRLTYSIHLSFCHQEAILQTILALLTFPIITLIYEILEAHCIRPAINQLKAAYPFLLVNAPKISSFLIPIYFFTQLPLYFSSRFEILVPSGTTNLSPWDSFLIESSFILGQFFPLNLPLIGPLDLITSVDSHTQLEFESTNRFLFSILLLTYFLWKWSLKVIPFDKLSLSNEKVMAQLKIDFILGLTLLLLLAVGKRLWNYFTWLEMTIGKWDADLATICMAISLALLAIYVPWDKYFGKAGRIQGIFNSVRPCQNDQIQRDQNNNNLFYKKKESNEWNWIHGFLFILSTIVLINLFFNAKMEDPLDSNSRLILGSEEEKQLEDDQQDLPIIISPERLKQIELKEEKMLSYFRAIYGFQILLVIRTFIN